MSSPFLSLVVGWSILFPPRRRLVFMSAKRPDIRFSTVAGKLYSDVTWSPWSRIGHPCGLWRLTSVSVGRYPPLWGCYLFIIVLEGPLPGTLLILRCGHYTIGPSRPPRAPGGACPVSQGSVGPLLLPVPTRSGRQMTAPPRVLSPSPVLQMESKSKSTDGGGAWPGILRLRSMGPVPVPLCTLYVVFRFAGVRRLPYATSALNRLLSLAPGRGPSSPPLLGPSRAPSPVVRPTGRRDTRRSPLLLHQGAPVAPTSLCSVFSGSSARFQGAQR
ncbi:hypothetical protein NDU88_002936 [Pleurodeles waltl]|uniref:Uncharacterized protein n=1 Tax=Pleurodeles waltl TaxID=8319 RepID=A0AAV7Q7J4_PLEWA|nr:hypothetical protein NDU88_002936 [Pleurodeles waltl]